MRRWTLATTLGVGLLTASAAAAQVDEALVYNGLLQLVDDTGSPRVIDGETSLRFTLEARDGTVLWTEEWSAGDTRSCGDVSACTVDVDRGRFSVTLGRWASGLDEFVRNGQSVFLRIGLLTDGGWATLSGRQQLAAVHAATRADVAPALDVGTLEVATALSVLGELDVTGAITFAGDAGVVEASGDTTTGDLTVTGAFSALSFTVNGSLTVSGAAHARDGLQAAGNTVFRVSDTPLGDGRPVLEVDGTGFGTIDIGTPIDVTGNVICPAGAPSCNVSGLPAGFGNVVGGAMTARIYELPSGTTQLNTGLYPDGSGGVFCAVAGFSFGDADLYTGANSGYYAYITHETGPWVIHADITSEGRDEDKTVGVICVDRFVAQVPGDDPWY